MANSLITQYRKALDDIVKYGGDLNEGAVRKAFGQLLNNYAEQQGHKVVDELAYATRLGTTVYPDATVKDFMRQDWGYWEAKDTKDDLDEEISKKFAKGYPNDNIIFENTAVAVLYQYGKEVLRVKDMRTDDAGLQQLLERFFAYERPEIKDFRRALQKFQDELPTILETLREEIAKAAKDNPAFRERRLNFLELCREAIDPKLQPDDVREMIIQHILTDELFTAVFTAVGDSFHKENAVAKRLDEVTRTFFTGKLRINTLTSIKPFYAAIQRHAASVQDHHEKQNFLNILYETFYKAYNPKAADKLGVVYTPPEIVKFMIRSTDELLHRHFNKALHSEHVQILDPATGTGTFITQLIEHIPKGNLPYKYHNEIHANEVALLPYYIASLNIEATYLQRMQTYEQFDNMVFIDTLDRMGFNYVGKQGEFKDFVEENTVRLKRQNKQDISVVIGNPPYNAMQTNYMDDNQNKNYPRVDERIKDTYVKRSQSQNVHNLYDMYTRFIRWATDRITDNGIVAFVTNRSYIDGFAFDGMRESLAKEFSEVYIIDLGGDIRANPKLSGTTHNVFGIQTGVCIGLFVKNQNKEHFELHYVRRDEFETNTHKLEWLSATQFRDIEFYHITPNEKNFWINQGQAGFEKLVPVASKQTKSAKKTQEVDAIFSLYTIGINTNRDEWVYSKEKKLLKAKVKEFIKRYKLNLKSGKIVFDDKDISVKFSSSLESYFNRGVKLNFSDGEIIKSLYRPFTFKFLYYSKYLNHRTAQWPYIRPFDSDFAEYNPVICFSGKASSKPFQTLAVNTIPSLDTLEKTQCLPRYRYEDGERIDNLTDWGRQQFVEHYADETITKDDIFHYTYAALHDPHYREKYELNLRRDFPRLPFHDDFHWWAAQGKLLIDLHINFEDAEPFKLKRVDLKDADSKPDDTPPKVKLRRHKQLPDTIELDSHTNLQGVPPEAWQYKLGNRSAIEWVLDQYKEKKPRDATIAEHFNTYKFADNKAHVIELLQKVTTVSVETQRIVAELAEKSGCV